MLLAAADAIKMYTQAIAGDQTNHALFSNRSAAFLGAGLLNDAVWDAQKCVQLAPKWSKAHFR